MPTYLGQDEQGNHVIQPDDPAREQFALSPAEAEIFGVGFNEPNPEQDPSDFLGGMQTPQLTDSPEDQELAQLLGLQPPQVQQPTNVQGLSGLGDTAPVSPAAPLPPALPPAPPPAAAPSITPASMGLGGDLDREYAQSLGTLQGTGAQSTAAIDDAIGASDATADALQQYEDHLPIAESADRRQAKERLTATKDAQGRLREIDAQVGELVAKEPDAGRWWSNRSDFQKAAAFISVIADGSLNPGGRNAALSNIMAMIDRDVASQDKVIERQLEALQRSRAGVFDGLKLEGDAIEARYAMRMTRLSSISRLIDARLKREQNSKARADLIEAKSNISRVEANAFLKHADKVTDTRLQSRQMSLQRRSLAAAAGPPVVTDPRTGLPLMMTVKGPDGKPVQVPVTARNEKQAIEASLMLADYKEYRAKLTELIGLVGDGGRLDTIFDKATGGARTTRASQLQADLGRLWLKMSGDERFSNEDMQVAEGRVILGPRMFRMAPTEALERLRATGDRMVQGQLAARQVYVGPGGVKALDFVTPDEDPGAFGAADPNAEPPGDGLELPGGFDTTGLTDEQAAEQIDLAMKQRAVPALTSDTKVAITRLVKDTQRAAQLRSDGKIAGDELKEWRRLYASNAKLRSDLEASIGKERLDETIKAMSAVSGPSVQEIRAAELLQEGDWTAPGDLLENPKL